MKFRHLLFIFFMCAFYFSSFAQWTTLNSGTTLNFNSVYFVNDSIGFTCGGSSFGSGLMLKTTNGGMSWDTSFLNIASPILSLFFPDTLLGYASKGDSMLKTTDGGNSWNALNFNFANQASGLFFVNGDTGFYAGGGSVYKTVNGGSSWSDIYPGFVSNTEGIYFFNKDTGIVGGWYNPILARTTDGGNSWNVISTQYSLRSLTFPSQNVGYGVGANTIIKSTDGGNSWVQQVSGLDSTQGLFSIFCTDSNTCYAVGSSGIILKTTDGGNMWTQEITGTVQPLHSIYCTDGNTCYAVGDSGVILKTTNGGVGINNIEQKKSEVSIYPNPAGDIITIHFTPALSKGEVTLICILDLLGRKIFQSEIPNSLSIHPGEIQIDVSDLYSGVYFIKVSENKFPVIRKFIKL